MASYVHRYKSELLRNELILSDLLADRFSLPFADPNQGEEPERNKLKVRHAMSRLKELVNRTAELESKIQDVLKLV